MLRVEMRDSINAIIVQIQGRFAGQEAEEICKFLAKFRTQMQLVVDLTDVTFVDSGAETVLSLFSRLGAKFIAEDSYSLDVCQRLELPMFRQSPRKRRQTAGRVHSRHASELASLGICRDNRLG